MYFYRQFDMWAHTHTGKYVTTSAKPWHTQQPPLTALCIITGEQYTEATALTELDRSI